MNTVGDRDPRIDDLARPSSPSAPLGAQPTLLGVCTVLRRSLLERRISILEQICAEAYQPVGALGAPAKALDNLAAAAAGKPIPHETFLPVSTADGGEFVPPDTPVDTSGGTAAPSPRG